MKTCTCVGTCTCGASTATSAAGGTVVAWREGDSGDEAEEDRHDPHDHHSHPVCEGSAEEACSCGHEHHHDHQDHIHSHDHDGHDHSAACSCGHSHGTAAQAAPLFDIAGGCACGHSHGSDPAAPLFETGCACGCGEVHGEGTEKNRNRDILALAAAAVVAVVTWMLTPPFAATAVLMAGAILLAGWPVLRSGVKSIAKLDFNELALMTIAVVAACFIGEFFEALLVTVLFRIGEMLEDAAVAHSRREVEAITGIIPDNANLLDESGAMRVVGARDLRVGDRILLKNGERVPVDCVVVSGSSVIDTSALTGESEPVEAAQGDTILSGSINIGGVLTCEAVSTLNNSTASRIIDMVRESAAQKGDTERLITRFSRIYTPIVIVCAVLIAALPPLFGFGAFSVWLSRALVFLVASCPCALVIATPLTFFAGIGAGSKNGILMKGSKYMEVLSKAESVVVDKTGTLTTGKLSISRVRAFGEYDGDEVLRIAASCEKYSNHPIARAITESVRPEDTYDVENCVETVSYGITATLRGEEILCGSLRLMDRYGIDVSDVPGCAVYVAKNRELIGAIDISDTPREDARWMVSELERMGIRRIVMLTGDAQASAEKVAELTGIREYRAGLLPRDKVDALEEIRAETEGPVLFLGDGINDSPVIARADAGIAMGVGSDAAIESADVVLLSNRLSSLPQAIRIARKTGKLARAVILFALAVKLIVFVLAFFGLATMWMAVFADVGVTVLSILVATQALRFR